MKKLAYLLFFILFFISCSKNIYSTYSYTNKLSGSSVSITLREDNMFIYLNTNKQNDTLQMGSGIFEKVGISKFKIVSDTKLFDDHFNMIKSPVTVGNSGVIKIIDNPRALYGANYMLEYISTKPSVKGDLMLDSTIIKSDDCNISKFKLNVGFGIDSAFYNLDLCKYNYIVSYTSAKSRIYHIEGRKFKVIGNKLFFKLYGSAGVKRLIFTKQ
jgi:hypothetical protein